MKLPKQWVETSEDVARQDGVQAAPGGTGGGVLRVRSATIRASRKVVQLVGGTWNVVITLEGKGTLLLRRRHDPASDDCPFLGCEIRHIEARGALPARGNPDGGQAVAGSKKVRDLAACVEDTTVPV